jgi:hypothetical protein
MLSPLDRTGWGRKRSGDDPSYAAWIFVSSERNVVEEIFKAMMAASVRANDSS